jgi:hypothetical protein
LNDRAAVSLRRCAVSLLADLIVAKLISDGDHATVGRTVWAVPPQPAKLLQLTLTVKA